MSYKIYTFPKSSPIASITLRTYKYNFNFAPTACSISAAILLRPDINKNALCERIKPIQDTLFITSYDRNHPNGMGRHHGIVSTNVGVQRFLTEENQTGIYVACGSEGPQHFQKFEQGLLDFLRRNNMTDGDPKIEEFDLKEIARKEIEKLEKKYQSKDRSVDVATMWFPGGGLVGGIFKHIGKNSSTEYQYLKELKDFVAGKKDNFPGPPSPQSPRDFGR